MFWSLNLLGTSQLMLSSVEFLFTNNAFTTNLARLLFMSLVVDIIFIERVLSKNMKGYLLNQILISEKNNLGSLNIKEIYFIRKCVISAYVAINSKTYILSLVLQLFDINIYILIKVNLQIHCRIGDTISTSRLWISDIKSHTGMSFFAIKKCF